MMVRVFPNLALNYKEQCDINNVSKIKERNGIKDSLALTSTSTSQSLFQHFHQVHVICCEYQNQ